MNLKSPQIAWAAVAIVFILIGGATVLAFADKDTGVILAIAGMAAVPVLVGFGAVIYQKVDKVDSNTNGNLTAYMNMVKDLHEKVTALALQVPVPPPADPEPLKEEDKWPGVGGTSRTS